MAHLIPTLSNGIDKLASIFLHPRKLQREIDYDIMR